MEIELEIELPNCQNTGEVDFIHSACIGWFVIFKFKKLNAAYRIFLLKWFKKSDYLFTSTFNSYFTMQLKNCKRF